MSRDYLALHAGSNRGAPVTDENPVPVKLVAGEGPAGLATAAGQDEIVAAIEGIEIPAPVGGALETTQEEVLAKLSETVMELPPRPLRTDAASFPTRTQIEQSGADTDPLLAAGGAGVQQFVYYGWLQTDIATVITFKSASTEIAKPITLAAGDMLVIGDLNAELPELYTADNEALNVTKSTAATLKGVLFSKAV